VIDLVNLDLEAASKIAGKRYATEQGGCQICPAVRPKETTRLSVEHHVS
jgi:hypothetical protein